MNEKKVNWAGAIEKAFNDIGLENIHLGMDIEKLCNSYFYGKLIKYIKGDDSENGSMYFHELKPLYDKYGYEKVNRVLLALEDEKGGKADE